MRTALDSNILSCIWSREPNAEQVATDLGKVRQEGELVLSGVAYAELLAHPIAPAGFLDDYFNRRDIKVDLQLVDSVWATAGNAFARYSARRRLSGGGGSRRLLADFIIGAHAMLQADRLMTLDPERYRHDFPELRIFAIA